jgi:sulfocyanin
MLRSRLLALAAGAALMAATFGPVAAMAATHPSPPFVKTQNVAKKTVTLFVEAQSDGANSGFNFNGIAKGDGGVTIPVGWQVTVLFLNKGPMPHSAVVTKSPASVAPAFPGAGMKNAKAGVNAGKRAEFTFRAAHAGKYYIICAVPGHEPAGMWARLTVSASAKKAQ